VCHKSFEDLQQAHASAEPNNKGFELSIITKDFCGDKPNADTGFTEFFVMAVTTDHAANIGDQLRLPTEILWSCVTNITGYMVINIACRCLFPSTLCSNNSECYEYVGQVFA